LAFPYHNGGKTNGYKWNPISIGTDTNPYMV
jgi:hypothetical protein